MTQDNECLRNLVYLADALVERIKQLQGDLEAVRRSIALIEKCPPVVPDPVFADKREQEAAE